MNRLFLVFLFVLIVIGMMKPSHSAPVNPNMNVTRAGTVTTYQVLQTGGTYTPPAVAPTGTGVSTINSTFGAQSSAYVSNAQIPLGETIAAFKVVNGVSAASLATGVLSMLKNPSYLNVALVAGSALLSYLNQSGIISNGDGTVSAIPNETNPLYPYASSSTAASCESTLLATFGTGSPKVVPPQYYCVYRSLATCPSVSGHGSVGTIMDQSTTSGVCGYYTTWAVNGSPTDSSSYVPITTAAAAALLTANPPADSSPSLAQIHAADPTGNSDPVADVMPTITIPSTNSYASAPKTSVNPDGSVQKTTDTNTATQLTPSSFGVTDSTVTVTTPNSGSVVTDTTLNAPSLSTATANNVSTPTSTSISIPTPLPISETSANTIVDCDKYPNTVGCDTLGTAPTPDSITTITPSFSLSPTSLGSGTCPASNVVTLTSGHTLTFSYAPYCSFAVMISPFVIALAWLSAGFIVLSPVRG